MIDATDNAEVGPPPRRGDDAWKAAKERIAARNSEVRKAGKRERQTRERAAAERRRAAEVLEYTDLSRGRGAR